MRVYLLLVACSESWEVGSPLVVICKRDEDAPVSSEEAQRGKRKADFPPVPPSRLVALRKARSWLEPYVMRVRHLRAFSDLPPPEELRKLLEGCSLEKAFTSMSADNKLPLQHLAVKLSHYESAQMDNAYSEDPTREKTDAVECSRPKSEVA